MNRRGFSPVTVVSLLGAAVIVFYAIMAVAASAHRPPTVDEAEYLHAGWLMHEGQRLYLDFFEHHAPFLFQVLSAVVPEETTKTFPTLDLVTYVTRARIVTAVMGLAAMLAAAWIAFRASRWYGAIPVTLAVLLVPLAVWSRALADIRNEAPSLMLFWIGAALLLTKWSTPQRAAILGGLGIGLAFASALWNPKWPLVCFFLGILYLVRLWQLRRAGPRVLFLGIAPALALVAITLAVILAASSLGDYIRFTFDYSWRIGAWWKVNAHHHQKFFKHPLALCPPLFKGVAPVAMLLLAVVLLFIRRIDRAQKAQLGTILALVISAALEVRFVAPWPNIWSQFFMMWCFAMAVLYAVTAGLAIGLLPKGGREAAGTVLVIAVMWFFVTGFSPRLRRLAEDYGYYYTTAAHMQQSLAPDDTVWLGVVKHPVGARDAHYIWFGFAEHVLYLLDAQKAGDAPPYLPKISEAELPPCRALRGLDPHVRFVTIGQDIELLPETRRCIAAMTASGQALVPMAPFGGFARIERPVP